MRITPNITLSFRKPKQADDASAPQETATDYVKLFEESATRIGVRLLIGAGALIAVYFICKTTGDVLTDTLTAPTE